MDIQAYKIKQELISFLRDQNINTYTPVQERVIPKILANKQTFVKAPTGSGKTFSFLLPLITNLDTSQSIPQVLIIVPTRELGLQIKDEIKKINNYLDEKIKSQLIIGGSDKNEEIRGYGNNHIIIATPTRLSKIHNEKSILLSSIKSVVIDEVDMIYDFGFLDELINFKNKNLQHKFSLSVFSATLNNNLKSLIRQLFDSNFEEITIDREEKIINYVINLNDRRRLEILEKLINSEEINPFLAIIFAKTNDDVKDIYNFLKTKNIEGLRFFNKDLTQRERKRLLKELKNNEVIYLITTDLMSRGMDFPGTSHIINYTMPVDPQYYIHRIGRTNRSFTKDGKIYTIADDNDWGTLKKIALKNNLELEKIKV